MAELTLAQAITQGLDEVLTKHDNTVIFGEDVGNNGGVFRITDGLQKKYGESRIFDTPLAESGILWLAKGLATTGFRPIPEIQFSGFFLEAMDPLIAQIARYRYKYAGLRNMPVTIRSPYGGGVHTPELHSDSMIGLFTQSYGARVVVPTNPYDAKGLIISAVESNDPVIFLEHLKMYRSVKGEVPEGYYTVPLDKAAIAKEGKDITIVAYGLMVVEALEAAKKLEAEGISAEVIDLRTVIPYDVKTVSESVKKTHRVIVVQEEQHTGGVGKHIASDISERCFMDLDAPVGMVNAPDTVYPFGQAESIWIPGAKDIIEKVKEVVNF